MGRSRYSDFFLIKDNLPITNSASFSFHDAFDFRVDMDLFRRLSSADDRPFFGLRSNFDFNWRSSFFRNRGRAASVSLHPGPANNSVKESFSRRRCGRNI